MLLRYAALASVAFAGLFGVFVVLRADTGSPCPFDDLLLHTAYVQGLVANEHPPSYRMLASRPLADCASVVELAGGGTTESWLEQVEDAFLIEATVHGLNAATIERFEQRRNAVIIAYSSYCSHREAMTAWLIEAFATRFPEGPELQDVTGQVQPDSLTVRFGLPLWPTEATE